MRRYLDGTAVLAKRYWPRDTIGVDKVYTDKKTVRDVQRKLHALAKATGNADFDPYGDGYKDDGVLGARTKLALVAFNSAFGWPADNNTITDGTLAALKRPDVVNPKGFAAQQVADQATQAQTPQQVQDAAAKLVAVAPAGAQDKALDAQRAAMAATTPAEVQAAKDKLRVAAEQAKAESAEGFEWGPILLGALAITGITVLGYKILVTDYKRAYAR